MRRLASTVALTLFAILVSGCGGGPSYDGPPMGKVTGKVTYNGNPVAGATVTMKGSMYPASGTTDESGVYTMTTSTGGGSHEGVPSGTVTVTITKFADMGAGDGTGEVDDSGMPAGFEKMTGEDGPQERDPREVQPIAQRSRREGNCRRSGQYVRLRIDGLANRRWLDDALSALRARRPLRTPRRAPQLTRHGGFGFWSPRSWCWALPPTPPPSGCGGGLRSSPRENNWKSASSRRPSSPWRWPNARAPTSRKRTFCSPAPIAALAAPNASRPISSGLASWAGRKRI